MIFEGADGIAPDGRPGRMLLGPRPTVRTAFGIPMRGNTVLGMGLGFKVPSRLISGQGRFHLQKRFQKQELSCFKLKPMHPPRKTQRPIIGSGIQVAHVSA